MTETATSEALEDLRKDYGKYFEAIQKHPRLLVGTQVPSLKGEGFETLRDSEDAREWQEATKQILVQEVKDRAQRTVEEQLDVTRALHASVELFTRNTDLIPGTKTFDKTLADRFTSLAKDYELRRDGKLIGYTVPVQGMIDQLRTQLVKERAASTAAPAAKAPEAKAPEAKTPAAPPEQPQPGILSQAGASGDGPEDFSTLFGTLGLPNIRI